jgi:hypothetical protein
MALAVTVEGAADADAGTAFDVIVPIDLARIFKGYGPLPAVTGMRGQTGGWDRVGAARTIELSDGSEVLERITAYERPRCFAYRVGPFTGAPMRWLVKHADGEWRFEDGTIRWTYTFATKPAGVLMRPVIARLWRAYANRVLTLAVDAVEHR